MKVSFLLAGMLFFQSAFSQYDFSGLDKKMEAAKKELDGHAMLLITKDGKPIYQKAIGEFGIKTQSPIGNTSKWLTAALVMSFVDEGKLALGDKVSKFLPYYTKYAKGFITIRDCLGDLTGIESETGRSLLKQKYASLEEEAEQHASKKEILSNPGLEFRYSNTGLNIAGRILEVMTKRSFEQLMQDRITRPLAMRNTSFASLEGVSPSSGAVSTPNDLGNFLTMLLNKGMFNGKRILSEKSIEDMQTAVTTPAMIKYAPDFAKGYTYGFGEWILQGDENGKSTVIAMPGMNGTWPMIDKCRGYGFVLLTSGKLKEERKQLCLELKEMIDAQIKSTCK
ncbi:serine hydrolase domain-containing protein [Sediminibacterium soli]|uniref:serine hydrolase domain-containing protein n=1 Tax=Sediminibacterium soli TaxID=2698829 RepID=UPI00137A47CF|nr:serine hydrolase domain-containing protein [Sediminibacterium soli]NCI45975.1 beta-lactamase family protein [Sediminibacterium soli]